MTDREKVIKGLEHCKEYGSLGGNNCDGHYEYTDNLQEIIKTNNHRKDCPYGQCRTGCVVTLVGDALAMLKEQEAVVPGADSGMCEICSFYERALPVKPVRDELTGRMWLCGKCGSYVGFEDNDPHDPNEYDKYCRECGRPVLWEGR